MAEPLPIDDKMIAHHISFAKDEYDTDLSREQAIAELEALKSRGCLLYGDCRSCPLYDDCRGCPKFGTCCPL